MSRLLEQQPSYVRRFRIAESVTIISVEYGKTTNSLQTPEGTYQSGCLRCRKPRCIEFEQEEITVSTPMHFPSNTDRSVCPTSAIVLNPDNGVPKIDPNTCVGCGLCVLRCPVGAIRLHDSVLDVCEEPSDIYVRCDTNDDLQYSQAILDVNRIGDPIQLTMQNVEFVRDRLSIFSQLSVNTDFPNVLVRNLLAALGRRAANRRVGNNTLRTDVVFELVDATVGLAEVQFGFNQYLEAPRDVLDSVAVLSSRFGWDRTNAHHAIVVDLLPNRRSEYWEMIHDIRKTVGLRISTLTVFSLLCFLWTGRDISSSIITSFDADHETVSYFSEHIQPVFGADLKVMRDADSFFDIAK